MLEHKGGSAEERKVLQTDSGAALLGCFYKRDKAGLQEKAGFWKWQAVFIGYIAWKLCFYLHKMADCSLSLPQEGHLAVKPWSNAYAEQWFHICKGVSG